MARKRVGKLISVPDDQVEKTMQGDELLHLQDAKEIIEKLLKYSKSYNKGDFKHELRNAVEHLQKIITLLN